MRREYAVEFTEGALASLDALDGSDQRLVIKQLEKLRVTPDLGQPLSGNLVNYRKMYAAKKRIRIVYCIEPDGRLTVTVIAIGARESGAVYAIAEVEAHQRRLRRIS